MGIKLIPGKRIPAFFVVVYQYGFRKTKGTGTPVLCSAGEFFDGYPPELFLKYIIFYGITIGIQKACQSIHHVCTEGLGCTLPSGGNETDDMVEHVIAIFIVDIFKGCNSTDTARSRGGCNGKIIGFHQITDDELLIIAGLYVCHEYFIRQQGLYIFHLVCEDICFVFISKVIIDHAPYRCLPGSRNEGNDLNGVLSIEYIVDAVSPADLHRIYLV